MSFVLSIERLDVLNARKWLNDGLCLLKKWGGLFVLFPTWHLVTKIGSSESNIQSSPSVRRQPVLTACTRRGGGAEGWRFKLAQTT